MSVTEKDRTAPMGLIKAKRLALGLGVESVAAAIGLARACYYDLEAVGSEIWSAVSLLELFRLCGVLKLSPREIFQLAGITQTGPESGAERPRGLAALRQRLTDELARTGETVGTFEDRAGWEVGAFLADVRAGLDWNVDCAVDVCGACGVGWLGVVQEEYDIGLWHQGAKSDPGGEKRQWASNG